MENQNLVESVLVGDSEGAFESFNSIIAEKLADALEVRKVQIASGIMAEESKEELPEPNYSDFDWKTRQFKPKNDKKDKVKEEVEQIDEMEGPRDSRRVSDAARRFDNEQLAKLSASLTPAELAQSNALKKKLMGQARSLIDKDTRALKKEEVEQIDERERKNRNYPRGGSMSGDTLDPPDEQPLVRTGKRKGKLRASQIAGMKSALRAGGRVGPGPGKKLPEEVEQIDEISVDLLRRAREKSYSKMDAAIVANRRKDVKKHSKQAWNFTQGIIKRKKQNPERYPDMTMPSMTEMAEEVEQIDELKASTINSYLDKIYGSEEDMKKRDAKIAKRMKASGTTKPNMGPVALGKVRQGPPFMRKKVKVLATNEEVEQVDEAQLSDAQKLAMMKEPYKAAVLSAIKRYQTVGGDINKLSAGHRTLVTNYLAKSGGLDSASRGAAMAALKSQAPKTDKM